MIITDLLCKSVEYWCWRAGLKGMVSVPSPFPQESLDEDIVRSVSDVTWLETVLFVLSSALILQIG